MDREKINRQLFNIFESEWDRKKSISARTTFCGWQLTISSPAPIHLKTRRLQIKNKLKSSDGARKCNFSVFNILELSANLQSTSVLIRCNVENIIIDIKNGFKIDLGKSFLPKIPLHSYLMRLPVQVEILVFRHFYTFLFIYSTVLNVTFIFSITFSLFSMIDLSMSRFLHNFVFRTTTSLPLGSVFLFVLKIT